MNKNVSYTLDIDSELDRLLFLHYTSSVSKEAKLIN